VQKQANGVALILWRLADGAGVPSASWCAPQGKDRVTKATCPRSPGPRSPVPFTPEMLSPQRVGRKDQDDRHKDEIGDSGGSCA
jgi:hypothetical protein